MDKPINPIIIPQAVPWLLRIAMNKSLAICLCRDPVTFAGWYAQIGEILPWPEEVQEIQRAEREQESKLTLERMLKLLSQINYTFKGSISARQARRILEGYAVHSWLQGDPRTLMSVVQPFYQGILAYQAMLESQENNTFEARLKELAEVLKLSALEQDVLTFAFLTSASEEIAGFFHQLTAERWVSERLWPVVFDTSKIELVHTMRAESPLRLCGLLQASDRRAQLMRVSQFWIDLLADSSSLFNSILEPIETKSESGMPARLLPEDQSLASSILRNANEQGVNLLLYGASSLEKRRLLRELVSRAGKRAWRVRRFEEADRYDRPALTYLAFQLLAKEKDAVLIVERPTDVLETQPSEFLKTLFGIEIETEGVPRFDEHLLSSNPVPGVWLASNAGSLPEETTARFVFHAPLKMADRATRVAALEELIGDFDLSEETRGEILKLEGVSSAQLESAVKAARLSGGTTKSERETSIVQAIRRSQRALNRDLQPKSKECVTQYALKYINAAGRFGPEQILQAFKRNPKGTLLLYGIPGTGKTQFAEYLAGELGLQLISRSASELLSKWLGESEKNIAKAFEDAANAEGILFLDEGDSFLRERSESQYSWEITQVNELLQHMERFPGIVIVATNLFRGLDQASMRRFTFKLEFLELSSEQRWAMFVNEAGLSETISSVSALQIEQWQSALTLMPHLTAGDFATVKRQSIVLNVTLSPEEWLSQLQLECEVKRRQPSRRQIA